MVISFVTWVNQILLFPDKNFNSFVHVPFHNSNVFKALFELTRGVKIAISRMGYNVVPAK